MFRTIIALLLAFCVAFSACVAEASGTAAAGETFELLGREWDVNAEELDLDAVEGTLTREDLEYVLSVMPNLKTLRVKAHKELQNDDVTPLVDAHPEITFVWTVRMKGYEIPSDATAFSTMVGLKPYYCLSDGDPEILRYVPGLRALDLGHHHLKDLSFLRYFPEMRILILADNHITDITWVGECRKLQYLELFVNKITDISPLANCTELLDVNLSWNWFLNVEVLNSCPKLERFWDVAGYTPYTKQLQSLRDNHPGIQI
ncbi:MAG: leucine-rich repeat domain-containing protein, partial [Clostridia bacterium]|nr:leucine-rich repeat domain-containing protein [Clostridia bacterium]